MRACRIWCASIVVFGVFAAPFAAGAQTQENAQSLQEQIDQLKRDFETLKQQYGDRLTALETKMAAIQGPTEAPPAQPPRATAQVPSGAEGAGGPSGQLP